MTTTQPTRISEVIRLNRRIDGFVEQRAWTASESFKRTLTTEITRLAAERDALELSLYEEYEITVER